MTVNRVHSSENPKYVNSSHRSLFSNSSNYQKQKAIYYSKQLLTGFEDNSNFVWPENGSVARSRRLRATDPFEGQTKLLLSEKPVYNCFVIHLLFFKIFLFTLSTLISSGYFQYSSVRSKPRHCDFNITSLIRLMKIRPSVNSLL